jgi:cell division protein FtsB
MSTSVDQVSRELARLREVVSRQADEIEVWRASDAELRGQVDDLKAERDELAEQVKARHRL